MTNSIQLAKLGANHADHRSVFGADKYHLTEVGRAKDRLQPCNHMLERIAHAGRIKGWWAVAQGEDAGRDPDSITHFGLLNRRRRDHDQASLRGRLLDINGGVDLPGITARAGNRNTNSRQLK